MSTGRSSFERFIRRVHRRYVAMRLLERTGLGVLGGCAAAVPLVAILLWRGMPAAGVAVAGPLIGAAAGVLWGMFGRPSRMAAALEADRQLGWDDLLSSAISIGTQFSNDSWADAVRAYADSRCRGVSPSRIILHRLGGRAWGGIGLATAFVLALGSIPTFVTPSRADDRQEMNPGPVAVLNGDMPQTVGAGSVSRRGSVQQEPEDAMSSRMNGTDSSSPQTAKPDSVAESTSSRATGSNDSSGTGAGATQSKSAAHPKPIGVADGTKASEGAKNGRPGGGAGQASPGLEGNGEPSGESAGDADRLRKVTPPWQSSDWPADSRRANAAVESGRIPDSYRDVIRGYFEHP